MSDLRLLWIGFLSCLALAAQTAPPVADNFFQPTAELNKTLPRWVAFEGSYRLRFEEQDGLGFKPASDTHLLGRLFLGVSLKPEWWLQFYAQGADSEMYFNGRVPAAPPFQNSWDLHQAWMQLGDAERGRLALRVGRQELAFGEQRLVGPSLWQNSPRVFDAALATVNVHGIRLDAFASSVVNAVDGLPDHHKQGNPLYGLYGSLSHIVPRATIEPFVFWRLAPVGYSAAYASGAKGHLDEKTTGFRWVGKLPRNLDYGAEMAYQHGSLGTRSISAWAGHWVGGYTFAGRATPRLFFETNYASGTANPQSSSIGTFDQLYPTSHNKLGLDDQVGWRNIRDLRTGVEMKPAQRLVVSAVYHNFWLANRHDGLYAANGSVIAKSLSGAAGSHVGQEIDLQGLYTLNKAIQFGFGFGHLFTGPFLNKTTAGKDYNFPYVMTTYAF